MYGNTYVISRVEERRKIRETKDIDLQLLTTQYTYMKLIFDESVFC